MKIFGKEFKTKKELMADIAMLRDELDAMNHAFPLVLGQTVYDVQLKNDKGRYAKKNASLDHSVINEVIVDTKNYFGLVERYLRQDVFLDYDTANAFLKEVCTNNK